MSRRDITLTQTEIEKMVNGAIVRVAPCDEQFLSQNFLVPKKQTCGELESQQVHHTQEAQDGRGSSLEGHLVTRGLDGIN